MGPGNKLWSVEATSQGWWKETHLPVRATAEELGGAGSWRNRNFCQVMGGNRPGFMGRAGPGTWSPGRERAGSQIQKELWFSLKSLLVAKAGRAWEAGVTGGRSVRKQKWISFVALTSPHCLLCAS